MKQLTKLQAISVINNKSSFNFNKIFGQGFNLGGASIGWMILLFIAAAVFLFALGYLPRFRVFGYNLIDVLNRLFVMAGMSGGVVLFYQRKVKSGKFDFADLFRGFQNQSNFGTLVAYAALAFLAEIVIGYISSFLLGFRFSPSFTPGGITELSAGVSRTYGSLLGFGLVSLIIQIVIQVLTFFVTYFIVIYKFGAIDSLELSVKLASKHFWPILGVLILLVILNIIGALLIGVGLLASMPITFGVSYMLFHYVFEKNVDGEEEPIVSFGDDILDSGI